MNLKRSCMSFTESKLKYDKRCREKNLRAREKLTFLRRTHNKFLFHTPHKSLLSSLSSHNEKWEKLRIRKKEERFSPAYMPFEEIFLIHFHPKAFDGLLLEAFVFQTERTNGWTDRWIHLISTWFRFFPFLSIYYFFSSLFTSLLSRPGNFPQFSRLRRQISPFEGLARLRVDIVE